MIKIIKYILLLFAITQMTIAYAKNLSLKTSSNKTGVSHTETPVQERTRAEEKAVANPFSIAFYKPTYILPLYYTGSPYKKVYINNTPNNQGINRSEFKYQFSFKIPVWQKILNYPSNLNVGYTQVSYWQLYNKSAFFRETDYEPELFLTNEIKLPLFNLLKLNFFNIGYVHQSNGFGDTLERSWNRIYLEFVSSTDNSMLSVKPWFVIHDRTMRKFNSNIARYMGYGQITFAYKYHENVLSFRGYNLIESGMRRPSAEVSWSFPLTSQIKGFFQLFSGYGQSLIEYDHRTNSLGVGIALSNWI